MLRIQPCDFQAIVVEVADSLRADLKACDGAVDAESLPTIAADRTLISQLVQNLIENAIKYRGPTPPRIAISASRQGEEWRFSVADNGQGIDPAAAHVIFEPFRQAQNSGRKMGIGLGLATCKRIVERHGGSIRADSQPGKGTAFHFTLPATLRPLGRGASEQPGEDTGAGA